MSSQAHNWNKVAEKLRRALGLRPPTPDEADKAIREARELLMSDDEIARIVQSVTEDDVPPVVFHLDDSWKQDIDTGAVAADSRLVMNRNLGDEDEAVDELVDELRKDALEDDDDAEQT